MNIVKIIKVLTNRLRKLIYAMNLSYDSFYIYRETLIASKGYAFKSESRPWRIFIFIGTEVKYSKLAIKLMYRKNAESYWINVGSSADVYAQNIRSLYEEKLRKNSKKFTLILSDGDWDITNSHTVRLTHQVLGLENLERMYVQNVDGSSVHEDFRHKVKTIPIGLDIHTSRKGLSPKRVFELLTNNYAKIQRKNQILIDFKNSISHPVRQKILQEVMGNSNFFVLESRVSQEELWALYRTYLAVLSPPGGGTDCHRTWEAIALGAVPVVLSGPLSELNRIAGGYIVNGIDDLNDENIIIKLKEHKKRNELRPARYEDYLK